MKPDRMLRLAVAMLAAVAVLAILVIAGWTQGLDDSWNRLMTDSETSWLVNVAESFAWLGAFPIAFMTVVAIGVAFLLAKRPWSARTWIVMVAVARGISSLSKTLIGRARPPNGLAVESSASFPSGHSMVSGAAMGIGLAIIAGRLWPEHNRLLLIIGTGYAVTMALSRTYLRVHWLTDAVGGVGFGAAIAIGVCAIAMKRREAHS
ncbi:MAG: phosphatase PAP2 family protein [bacterium]|nr:phosphatase PAP2 family protein [bacterium]MCP4966233.1 phosphatase PAP2 family protein [bacterium]